MVGDELIEILRWRYAVKKFDPAKKISKQDWEVLEQSLVLTPSSYGLQPWKFLVIDNPEVRKQLTPVSWRQKQVEDASHFVVFAAKTSLDEKYLDNFLESTATTRGVPVDSLAGYRKVLASDLIHGPRSKMIPEWAALQAYIALGNFMTCAALLKVDTCPMEGIDPVAYDKILGLEGSGYATRVACAAGYRSDDDKYASALKVRFDRAAMVQHV